MKYWIVISIIVLLAIGAFSLYHKHSSLNTQQVRGNMFVPGLPGSNDPPTPTIPFSMKQTCSDDANRLTANLNNEKKTVSSVNSNNTGYVTEDLQESTFSNDLNTCVADIMETTVEGNTVTTTHNLYDTTDNKFLAQCDLNASKGSFDAVASCGKNGYVDWDVIPSSALVARYKHNPIYKPSRMDFNVFEQAVGL